MKKSLLSLTILVILLSIIFGQDKRPTTEIIVQELENAQFNERIDKSELIKFIQVLKQDSANIKIQDELQKIYSRLNTGGSELYQLDSFLSFDLDTGDTDELLRLLSRYSSIRSERSERNGELASKVLHQIVPYLERSFSKMIVENSVAIDTYLRLTPDLVTDSSEPTAKTQIRQLAIKIFEGIADFDSRHANSIKYEELPRMPFTVSEYIPAILAESLKAGMQEEVSKIFFIAGNARDTLLKELIYRADRLFKSDQDKQKFSQFIMQALSSPDLKPDDISHLVTSLSYYLREDPASLKLLSALGEPVALTIYHRIKERTASISIEPRSKILLSWQFSFFPSLQGDSSQNDDLKSIHLDYKMNPDRYSPVVGYDTLKMLSLAMVNQGRYSEAQQVAKELFDAAEMSIGDKHEEEGLDKFRSREAQLSLRDASQLMFLAGNPELGKLIYLKLKAPSIRNEVLEAIVTCSIFKNRYNCRGVNGIEDWIASETLQNCNALAAQTELDLSNSHRDISPLNCTRSFKILMYLNEAQKASEPLANIERADSDMVWDTLGHVEDSAFKKLVDSMSKNSILTLASAVAEKNVLRAEEDRLPKLRILNEKLNIESSKVSANISDELVKTMGYVVDNQNRGGGYASKDDFRLHVDLLRAANLSCGELPQALLMLKSKLSNRSIVSAPYIANGMSDFIISKTIDCDFRDVNSVHIMSNELLRNELRGVLGLLKQKDK